MQNPLCCAILAGLLGSCLHTQLAADEQSFSGTNLAGAYQVFPVTLVAGTSNLSIQLDGNSTNYGLLYLAAGRTPTSTNYDYRAVAPATNTINLELPELLSTNYEVRVRAPATVRTQLFTLHIATDIADLGSSAHPINKEVVSTSYGAATETPSWHYYRIDVSSNLPPWRAVTFNLDDTNAPAPDLYLGKGQIPTFSSYVARAKGSNPNTLFRPSQTLTNDLLGERGGPDP